MYYHSNKINPHVWIDSENHTFVYLTIFFFSFSKLAIRNADLKPIGFNRMNDFLFGLCPPAGMFLTLNILSEHLIEHVTIVVI